MAAKISHTDVICLEEDQECRGPSCPHGPSLLFERFNKSSGQMKKFFACSAFRDRKACSFFRWADSVKEDTTDTSREDANFSESHEDQRKRYFIFKDLAITDRHVCCSCGLLLLPGELSTHETKGHIIKNKVTLKSLQEPSYLFVPRDDKKTYAQYLFSRKTVNFIIDVLSSKFSNFLCIGTPRIHEMIQRLRSQDKNVNSFLLDLDQRYGQLYSSEQYAQYNMFNHHFFDDHGQDEVLKFLSNKKCVFLIDPPFGGMVEPLALSLTKLSNLCLRGKVKPENNLCSNYSVKSCDVPFLLFSPYFMEKRILSSIAEVTMLDYKVDYDNHDLYKDNGKKKGSPVRIFVHKSLSSLELPSKDGYWWCELCKRFSASENWHCKECESCTSKDGTKYVHCDMCERCVKPSRKHCFKCSMCQVQDHVCHGTVASTTTGCFICGEKDHKRRKCPQRIKSHKKGKRKGETEQEELKLKKTRV